MFTFTKDCSDDIFTGDGSFVDVTSDTIFTGDMTGDEIITDEAFSPLNTLKIPDFQLIFTVCNR